MRSRFDEQLSELNTKLITMGALCEEAISAVSKCLTENDDRLCNTVYESDRQIDNMQREIENLCMRLILQQQPVAKDLRIISSALKIISDMERIGDQASDIAEMARFVSSSTIIGKIHIDDMARSVIKMVTDSIESFVKKDVNIAFDVIRHDDVVDDLFLKIKNELISEVRAGADNAEALIDLLMIAKYFERIGDHAENIAQWVIYSITGKHEDDE